MAAALEVELLKLRRSVVARTGAVAVVGGVTALAAGFMALAGADSDSAVAAKVVPMLHGTGWVAYLGLVGQVLSVAVLLAVGVVTSWSFGREFVDGTFGSLFAGPTPRARVAAAKLVVLLGWGLAVCVATVVLAAVLGLVIGLGPPDTDAAAAAARAVAVGVLMVLLALPLALVASIWRGYLPGVAALLGVVVVTQVATVLGAGAWFPYAAPGLWAGLGGADAAVAITPVQLLLAVPVSAAGWVATVRWWDRAQVV
ncbi:ABC transporter permease [Cellulomonas sp. ATA003]|uniref:ABC transporter permease n=1 Tax=Cellulomonas sp. ATA003 TaxID=3073064 RepID=UPI002873202A|nr:ABC transporter permease [Cellulomonas sp. ATA003]WNB87268.1 ABC transporter permease [Cellulomonas sp. ATA003]